MSISYQFGDVDAHGAMIRSQAASLESEHQASFAMCWLPVTSGVARVRWLARSSSPSWVGTSRRSTSRPTATARRCRPPATTCRAPTRQSGPAGPDAYPGGRNTPSITMPGVFCFFGYNRYPCCGRRTICCSRADHARARAGWRPAAYSATAAQPPRMVVDAKLAALARWLSVGVYVGSAVTNARRYWAERLARSCQMGYRFAGQVLPVCRRTSSSPVQPRS